MRPFPWRPNYPRFSDSAYRLVHDTSFHLCTQGCSPHRGTTIKHYVLFHRTPPPCSHYIEHHGVKHDSVPALGLPQRQGMVTATTTHSTTSSRSGEMSLPVGASVISKTQLPPSLRLSQRFAGATEDWISKRGRQMRVEFQAAPSSHDQTYRYYRVHDLLHNCKV